MNFYISKNNKGFTLLEILLVIALIAILAGIVVVAINPLRQLAEARNAQRFSDVRSIYNATNQYFLDHGSWPASISSAPLEICRTGASSCTGLADLSVLTNNSTYLTSMPIDPFSSVNGTGYEIYLTSNNSHIVIVANLAELSRVIEIGVITSVQVFTTPISYWSFDDASSCTALDNVDGNSGTLNPTCPGNSPSWTLGKINGALSFNGVDNYININNAPNLNPTAALTLSAWVKWTIDPGTGLPWASIINKNGDNQYRLQHNNVNAKFEFGLRTTGCAKWVQSTTSPVKDVWYFVTGTYDGQSMKLYVNGTLESNTSCSGTILTSSSPVGIGRRSIYYDRYFNGLIDEAKIYSSALADTEIQSLYTAGN
jgi:prepilin-type N-terminal cleavage/methylation domain-containing protein